jgi:hypothetical protein
MSFLQCIVILFLSILAFLGASVKRGTLNFRCHVCSCWSSTLLNVSDRSGSVSHPCSNVGQTLLLSSRRDLDTATNGVGGVEVVDSGRVYRSHDSLGFVCFVGFCFVNFAIPNSL